MTQRTTRAERLAQPRATEAVTMLAEASGGCIRPVQLRRTNLDTGEIDQVIVPCGSPLESVCPACAERCKSLRMEQCRDGWHLENEPIAPARALDDWQTWLLEKRAEFQQQRDQAAATGQDLAELDELLAELDDELGKTGIRGKPDPSARKARRHRSTRRRQDAPGLPRKKISQRTTGKVYTAPSGKAYRPSMFVTLTLDSYGKVTQDGTPADLASYDYQRAARDAIHFAALFDRFIQNLRRCLGYDVQYFAAIEPQRRLAPHAHIAFRGAISRADLRQVIAATYHQVWWPATDVIKLDGDRLPVWRDGTGYFDPATGEVLPTWDQALDAIGPTDRPLHVARFGPKFDAQGVLAGSKDSGRCIRYLTKYLTKSIGGCHAADTPAQEEHAARLLDALRYEPCSPRCANWLRYGIQPKNARKGLRPGCCKGKAHRADNLGYAGRRVPASRKWSGKTMADHRADRKTWLLSILGLPDPDDTGRYRWETVTPNDPDFMTHPRRMLHVLADRAQWHQALAEARRRASEATGEISATRGAA